MSFLNSLSVSLFGMSVVFVVLIVLSAVVAIQSKLVKTFGKRANVSGSVESAVNTDENVATTVETDTSTGEFKLTGVDERTAAMIMAIVSHESQIPLSELQFKSIKAVE